MHYDNLRAKSIEDLLNCVQALATVGSRDQVQSVMALLARCTVEVGDRLTKLTDQLERSRAEMARASDTSSEHTAALVRWTKVLVFVTAAYTLLTGGLLLVAILRST